MEQKESIDYIFLENQTYGIFRFEKFHPSHNWNESIIVKNLIFRIFT